MNAIQAMVQPGAVTVELSTAKCSAPQSPEARNWVRVRIEDEGPGIPPDVRPHMFEPFFTTRNVGEATGLGLSISLGIVQEHGGWIDVASKLDKGARFDIYLPLEQSQ
jgi:signal transduction histidine kinase